MITIEQTNWMIKDAVERRLIRRAYLAAALEKKFEAIRQGDHEAILKAQADLDFKLLFGPR